MDKKKIEKAVKMLLEAIGEDPGRAGIKKTPERYARLCEEVFSGIKIKAGGILKPLPSEYCRDLVIVKDIPFYSMCEHHLLPFFGKCHIAYIPNNKKVLGISKLAEVVDILSKRLQVQESLTVDIIEAIMDFLRPKGAAVVMKARHMCMEMRGVKKSDTYAITSAVRGVFMKDIKTREEFLKLIE